MTLAEHVAAIAAEYKIKVVHEGITADKLSFMVPEIVVPCSYCKQRNRIVGVGLSRCGRCKREMGWASHVALIAVMPVVDDHTYAIALHELGHRLAPNGTLYREKSAEYRATGQPATVRDLEIGLMEERAAWAWARSVALYWTPAMARAERIGTRSYTRAAKAITGKNL